MQKVHRAAFNVVGYEVRTNNRREALPEGLIGKQWERLFHEGIIPEIARHSDSAMIALYTDYAFDEHGDYTYVLGTRVHSCVDVPEQMTCRYVPAAAYILLESERGALPGIVLALWQKVWKLTPQQLGGARSFRNDYEVYDARAANPAEAQIDLYLGVD